MKENAKMSLAIAAAVQNAASRGFYLFFCLLAVLSCPDSSSATQSVQLQSPDR
jgi:hypothetical protein